MSKLYKIENARILVSSLYVKAENIDEAKQKAEKHYLKGTSIYKDEYKDSISKIELISNNLIE